jgi:uncharacterized protein YggE
MRKTVLAVLAVLALAVLFALAGCNEKEGGTVRVTGRAEVTLRAEKSIIHLNVKLVRKDMTQSHDALIKTLDRVTKDMTDIGLKAKNVKRSLIEQGPEYRWKDDTRYLAGYYSEASVEVHMNDIDLMPKAYRTLAAHDDVSVSYTEFKRSDEYEQRMEQYEKALKAARKKAEKMAGTLDARLGEVRSIAELGEAGFFSANPVSNVASFGDQRSSAGSSVSAGYGYVTIEGRVVVEFELE